ncbi:MAG: prepilin-type N-terminal cleavage/methylation domain-containing protein [Desulfobacterales bacterium]|nr:prepilin-type N-terminal cleavage/methylation domain-containing protein [Desulfobacterales bacterium]
MIPPNPANPINARGFTLLEVMMALSVMAVVLVSVFRMGAQTMAMEASARFNAVAPLLAQQKLGELITGGHEAPYTDSGRFENQNPAYAWKADMEAIPFEMSGITVSPINRLEVKVSLESSGQTFTLRTYRMEE